MYALIKWKPWTGDRSNAWGNILEPSDDHHLTNTWSEHCRILLESGSNLPDSFHRDVRFAAQEAARLARLAAGDEMSSGNYEVDEDQTVEDWMQLAQSIFAQDTDNEDAFRNIIADQAYRCPCVNDSDNTIVACYAAGNIYEIERALTTTKHDNAGLRREMPPIRRNQLNEEQLLAHDAFINGPEGLHILMGEAGTGKSHVIQAIVTTAVEAYGQRSIMVTATTEKAASAIGGSTLQGSNGLRLMRGMGKKWSVTSGRILQQQQEELGTVSDSLFVMRLAC